MSNETWAVYQYVGARETERVSPPLISEHVATQYLDSISREHPGRHYRIFGGSPAIKEV